MGPFDVVHHWVSTPTSGTAFIVAVVLGVIGALAKGTQYLLIIGVMVLVADLSSSEPHGR
ncbi:hypothetical protein [Streptomyces sp. NPDC059224]|uniref:hypothetical protein n=1 Tax=Streptomyces sp. NPDC059224 TaxID=3346775 RepID=UPI0036C0EBB1